MPFKIALLLFLVYNDDETYPVYVILYNIYDTKVVFAVSFPKALWNNYVSEEYIVLTADNMYEKYTEIIHEEK